MTAELRRCRFIYRNVIAVVDSVLRTTADRHSAAVGDDYGQSAAIVLAVDDCRQQVGIGGRTTGVNNWTWLTHACCHRRRRCCRCC